MVSLINTYEFPVMNTWKIKWESWTTSWHQQNMCCERRNKVLWDKIDISERETKTGLTKMLHNWNLCCQQSRIQTSFSLKFFNENFIIFIKIFNIFIQDRCLSGHSVEGCRFNQKDLSCRVYVGMEFVDLVLSSPRHQVSHVHTFSIYVYLLTYYLTQFLIFFGLPFIY